MDRLVELIFPNNKGIKSLAAVLFAIVLGHTFIVAGCKKIPLMPLVGDSSAQQLASINPQNLPLLPPDSHRSGLLGAGDVILIQVTGQAELSGKRTLPPQGPLSFPLIGSIPAAGLTPDSFKEGLVRRLEATYFKEVQILVEVKERRPFFVLGAVKKPGQYPYLSQMTVAQALATAGGLLSSQIPEFVLIKRSHLQLARTYRAGPDAFLAPGDLILIPLSPSSSLSKRSSLLRETGPSQ